MRLIYLFFAILLISAPLFGGPINAAASANGGVATQSSTLTTAPGDFGPQYAIDGNTDGYRYTNTGTLQHTDQEALASWQVMFNADYILSSVTIYNRLEGCCRERISPFSVFLLDAGGVPIVTLATGQTIPSDDPTWTYAIPDTVAHGLRVQLDGTNWLHMAQVEVEGTLVPEPASLLLLGTGVIAAARFTRRRTRA